MSRKRLGGGVPRVAVGQLGQRLLTLGDRCPQRVLGIGLAPRLAREQVPERAPAVGLAGRDRVPVAGLGLGLSTRLAGQ